MKLENVVNADTGEPIEAYTPLLIGVKVIIQAAEGTVTDWIDEVYCPVCEAHYIGTRVGVGGFLARHNFFHNYEDSRSNAGIEA